MWHVSRESPKPEAVVRAPLVEPATCDFSVHQGHVGLALLVGELRPGRKSHLDHKCQNEKRRNCYHSLSRKDGTKGKLTLVSPIKTLLDDASQAEQHLYAEEN